VVLVRAGSARRREASVLGGHERSRQACSSCRLAHVHRADPGRLSAPTAGSNPTAGCRGPGGPCERSRRRRGRASPAVELVPTPAGPTNVVLVGRATTVPFTGVPTGLERTLMDNARQARTCVVSCLRRRRYRPIWLWEQVVSQRAQLLGPSFGDEVCGDFRALNAGPGTSAVLSRRRRPQQS
jgi:hypothetical protein